MTTTITTENGKTLVSIAGRLDTTNSSEFEKELAGLLCSRDADITLDCSGLDYISSSGLRIFVTLQKHVNASAGKLTINNMRPAIKEVFDMTGLSSVFTIE